MPLVIFLILVPYLIINVKIWLDIYLFRGWSNSQLSLGTDLVLWGVSYVPFYLSRILISSIIHTLMFAALEIYIYPFDLFRMGKMDSFLKHVLYMGLW